jgi:hypothetical protein
MKQLSLDVEGVRQAMGRVDAHHQGAVSETGKFQPGSRRQTGFPHPSFAAEQKDAHNSILARSDGGSIRAAKHRWAGVGIARLPRYRSNSAVPAAGDLQHFLPDEQAKPAPHNLREPKVSTLFSHTFGCGPQSAIALDPEEV